MIDLVRHLPDLEQLCLAVDSPVNRILLKESTYVQLCEIYCQRNKKLTISNYDMSDAGSIVIRIELFPGLGIENDRRKFLQYFTVRDWQYYHNAFSFPEKMVEI